MAYVDGWTGQIVAEDGVRGDDRLDNRAKYMRSWTEQAQQAWWTLVCYDYETMHAGTRQSSGLTTYI